MEIVKPKRKYLPIWDKLKSGEKHQVTLIVHPALLARVKKAVIKEKHQDLGFKVLNGDSEDYFYLRFNFYEDKSHPAKSRLKIKLKQRLGLEEIKV